MSHYSWKNFPLRGALALKRNTFKQKGDTASLTQLSKAAVIKLIDPKTQLVPEHPTACKRTDQADLRYLPGIKTSDSSIWECRCSIPQLTQQVIFRVGTSHLVCPQTFCQLIETIYQRKKHIFQNLL